MKRQTYLPLLCLWLTSASALFSAPIQNLKFTDVVKEVKILNVATKAETTAKVGDVLVPPNVIKTGADSRAELVAEDQTVTRVGANTIFSVEANSRDVNIAKGSVLFHSPAGKGGGNIKSAGATASVLGTTLIVGANQSGGFKVMLLEGKGQVSGAGGGGTKLTAGQMSFAMPGQAPSQPLNFELKGQVSGSKLVGGFSKPLASIAKIEAAVNVQQTKIASGEMASTGLMIGDSPSVAFKVDSAVVRVTAETVQKAKDAVVRARVAQAQTEAANAERTRQKLDPRFLAAVRKELALTNLSLTSSTTPTDYQQPIPLTLEKLITGSAATTGNFTIGADGGWGAPLGIPGNREEKNDNPMGSLTMLLGGNIVFENPTSGQSAETFLIAPMYPGKNYNGVVALENIDFKRSVDFVEGQLNHAADPEKPAFLENLFLTAGDTITAGRGTVIKSSHATNFDIYAGGTGFTGANSRTGFFSPASGGATPLSLTDTMIWNARNWTEQASSEDGSLSIEAPSMDFNNVTLSAGQTSPATISLKSAGAITLTADSSVRDSLLEKGAAYTNQMGAMTVASMLATGTTASGAAQKVALSSDALNDLKSGLAPSLSIPLTQSQEIKVDELFNGIALQSAAVAQNSAEITVSSVEGLVVGMGLAGAGIPDGATVTAINGDTNTITMSDPATGDSSGAITALWTSTQFADKRNALLTELNDALVASVRAQGIQVPLPLGFSGPEALAIQAFNVSIVSKGKPISINGVPIYANNISVSSGSVPLVATETDARVFTPTDSSMAYADKLYVPIAKYDSDQNGVISQSELSAAHTLLSGKSVSGANVPTGTTIQGVSRAVSVPSNAADADAQSYSNMLELNLSGPVAFSGQERDGSVTETTSVAGKFKTGTITIGETSADFPEGTIAISSIRPDGVKRGATSAVDLKIEIQATGSLELNDNDFSVMTHVDLRSKQAALLENNLFASDAELNVWAHEDITFKGVSVYNEPRTGGATNPKVSVESNSKSVYVNTNRNEFVTLNAAGLHTAPTTQKATRTVFKATAVSFTADNGDVVIHNTNFATGTEANTQFAARAKDHVAIYNSNIDHSKALIAANTVVLKDVEFQGNDVTLRSRTGFVAAEPGTGKAVSPGHVNFVSGVYYNNTEVKLPGMTSSEGHAEFHRQAGLAGKNLGGLKIQTLGGVTH